MGDIVDKNGITRRIDDLGRIVIPKEIRKNMHIKDFEEILINVLDNKIILSKYEGLEKDKIIHILLNCLNKFLNINIYFTSRNMIIDYALNKSEKLENNELSDELKEIIEKRKVCIKNNVKLLEKSENDYYILFPLIINGDLKGSIFLSSKKEINDIERKIIEFTLKFLEIYLE